MVQRFLFGSRGVGLWQGDAGGEFEPQVCFGVYLEFATDQPDLEYVSARAPVAGYEMEVVACHVQALCVEGKSETDEAPRYFPQLEGGLMLDDLGEGRVGFLLARDAARLYVIKGPVQAHGVARGVAANEVVQARA